MLEVSSVAAWYQRTQALFDVSFRVEKGQCLALVGTNGAGKTTIIRSLLGLVKTAGRILIDGEEIQRIPTAKRVRSFGISTIHEGRGLFPELTVRENILVGQPTSSRARLDEALTVFPTLTKRLNEKVSLLSGGQQQMVAISRAIVQRPRLLLLDEPSLGLAPSIVDEIYNYLKQLRGTGLTIVLVEQNIARVASLADAACLIRTGHSGDISLTISPSAIEALITPALTAKSHSKE